MTNLELERESILKMINESDMENVDLISLRRLFYIEAIQGKVGGGIVIDDSHFFTDTTDRDNYFVANPTELVEKIFCMAGTDYYQYVDSTWRSVTAIVKGEKGEDGAGLTDQSQTITGVKSFDTLLTAGNEPTETWGTNYGVLKLGQNCSLASNKTAKGGMFINQNMYWDNSWKRINDGVFSSVIMSTNGSCKYFMGESDLANTDVTLSNPVMTISADKKLGLGTDTPLKKLHLKFDGNDGMLSERVDTGVNGLKTIAELRSTTTSEISTDISDTSFGAYVDFFVDDSILASPQKIGLAGFSVDGDKGTSKFQLVPYKAGSPNLSGLFKINSEGTVVSRGGFEAVDTYLPSVDASDERSVFNQTSQLSIDEDYNVTSVKKHIINQDLEILNSGTSTTATNLQIHGFEQHLVNSNNIQLGRLRGINSLIENNGAGVGYIDGVKSEITTGSNSNVPNLYGGNFRVINGGTANAMVGLEVHLRNIGGIVSNMYGLKVDRVPFGYTQPTNAYGLYIEELNGSSNNFGIYQQGKCNNELQGTFKVGSYTTAEMSALTDIDGMQIYNTETKNIHINDGTKWNKISKTIDLTDEVQTNSYRKSVIALCSVDNTVTDLSSFSSGKLIFKRPNGLQGILSIDFNIEKLYNTEQINVDYVIRGMEFIEIEPCTFTYNGNKYGGLTVNISNSAHSQVFFEGETNFDIFGVDYYDTQNTTALISEINDSINTTTDINLKDNFYVNGLVAEGYSKLGEDSPKIKIKKLTGVTSDVEGGTVDISHGLSGDKILSITSKLYHQPSYGIPAEFTGFEGFQYSLWHDSTDIKIINSSTNSANILSKNFSVTIMYEE